MAEVKVTVKTTWGAKNNTTFQLKAKTLGKAATELDKRDEWGKFDGKITYDYDSDENDYVTKVTLKPSYTLSMPVWGGYKKAPKECQKEWDKMYKALEKHEDGHRLIHLETLATIENALQSKTDYAASELKTDFAQWMQDGQDNQDKFDKSTANGANKGVELTITDECT